MAEAVQTGGSSQTGSTAEQVQDKARDVAGQAQEKAGQAAEQARSTVRTQVDQRSTQIGEQVSSQAGDVRTIAEELRNQGKDKPAELAEKAAGHAERVGSWLTESDGDALLRDVEDFGRRKPWAIALGGMAVGFAASRLLKASSTERYRSSYSGGTSTGGGSDSGRAAAGESYGGTYGGAPVSPDPATTRLPATSGVGGPANGSGTV